jgi:ribonuclease-3 family protein
MKATGFEAVLGYLYLTDRTERVLELVKKGLELTELYPGREKRLK